MLAEQSVCVCVCVRESECEFTVKKADCQKSTKKKYGSYIWGFTDLFKLILYNVILPA